jgi:hypothetical protein
VTSLLYRRQHYDGAVPGELFSTLSNATKRTLSQAIRALLR